MVSTFTPNINLENPARGDDTGTWDTPVVSNMTALDLILGGSVTIPLTNANVTLNTGQYQCAQIIFTGALSGNVFITLPAAFKKPYTIQNRCTGAFQIQLGAAGGGQIVACPPGQVFDIVNDGTDIRYKNFGPPIGGYWDYASASFPQWVNFCTIPPYLNCDGSAFNPSTYPVLNSIIGTNVLPDFRGRMRAYLNQGVPRINAGVSGVDGNTLRAGGGDEQLQQHGHGFTGSAMGNHNHPGFPGQGQFAYFGPGPGQLGGSGITMGQSTNTGDASAGTPAGTVNAAGGGFSQNMPPTCMGGLTLIRAA